MGKILGVLFILGMLVLGLLGSFIRYRDWNDVGDGKERNALREVFKMRKEVLEVF